jgi:predicted RNase H-like HicB family nuclease
VYVAAFDEFGGVLADGETRQSHIVAGGQTIVAVMLNTAVPPLAVGEGGR